MDDNQVKNILDEFDEKTEKLPDTSLTSLAIQQVKEEYKHAGIDLEKFQINYNNKCFKGKSEISFEVS